MTDNFAKDITLPITNKPMEFSLCIGLAALLILLLPGPEAAQAKDWPQFRGPNRDSVWNETGILQTFPAAGLKIRWRAPIGAGHSSPVVVGGRVYVTDAQLEKPKVWERTRDIWGMPPTPEYIRQRE